MMAKSIIEWLERRREAPYPLDTLVTHLNGQSAISRVWLPGDTQRCSLAFQ
jgi:hypothetical protein